MSNTFHLIKGRKLHFICLQQLQHLGFIQLPIPLQQEGHRFPINGINQCFHKIIYGFLEECRNILNCFRIRSFHDFHIQRLFIGWPAGIDNLGDFQITGEVTALTGHHDILPDFGDCLKFLRQRTAHSSGIRLDDLIVQIAAIHDILICLKHLHIGFLQTGFINIKGIRVLHDEFTHTDQSIARSCLITEFCLNLIQVIWKILIGASLHHRCHGKQLFMGRSQHIIFLIAVL